MNIHESFYTKKFKDTFGFYKESEVERQVEFIEKIIPLNKGQKILDLACGYGRHSICLKRKGYDITGYDLSSDLLEIAREKAKELQLNITFTQKDMKEIELMSEFDIILSLSTALSFYDDNTNFNIFKRIFNALKPGGYFLYDQGNIFKLMQLALKKDVDEKELPGGIKVMKKYTFDAKKCILKNRTAIIYKNKEKDESGWDIRYYILPELEKMMNEIGFNILNVYGDYEETEYTMESDRLIVLMKK